MTYISSFINTCPLMLFWEMICIYGMNHSKHNYEIFGKNAEVLMFRQVVHMVTTGL